ncbi:MAG: ATP synthase F1 subunit epsilon [Treponema sp.]|jgi:F-type H+-transporting ATPase subunit epsilon|nr:ATP synthase F1 subunit epsilon [Treponema sp.]
MAKLYPFEVHTPYRLFYSGSVEGIILTLSDGEIGVFADHSYFTAPVVPSLLKIKDNQGLWQTAFVSNGILEVKNHKTVLMVDSAEWPNEIDCGRALTAKKAAEEVLESRMFKFETLSAREKLRRAEIRLKVAELQKKPE